MFRKRRIEQVTGLPFVFDFVVARNSKPELGLPATQRTRRDDEVVPRSTNSGTTSPDDEAVFSGEGYQVMWSVTAWGPGLVAVGWFGSFDAFDAAVWTSPDGISWSRVPHDGAVLGGESNMEMFSVTLGGPGLVAVGLGRLGSDFDAVEWVTAGGDR